MASGGSGKGPPRTPHRPMGYHLRGAEQRPHSVKAPNKRHSVFRGSPSSTVWRRLRRHIRSLWRWMVLRTVRSLANRWTRRVGGIDQSSHGGDVRQFPGGK